MVGGLVMFLGDDVKSLSRSGGSEAASVSLRQVPRWYLSIVPRSTTWDITRKEHLKGIKVSPR